MTFGSSQQERYGEITKETAIQILDTFYAGGGNFIDTASVYQTASRKSGSASGWFRGGSSTKMMIATKYTSAWRLFHKDEIQSNFVGNGTKCMEISVEALLKKLRTNYIDILYIH